jgi:DNA-binding NarL/FixJ family response regulator
VHHRRRGVAAGTGNAQFAAELLAIGTTQRERLGVPLRPGTQATLDAVVDGVRRRLGAAKFAAAWESGRAMPIASAESQATTLFAAMTPQEPAPYGLTRREHDVLRLVAAGRSDKDIADALFVSARTASGHISAILAKLGVESHAAAVAIAFRLDLI